MVNEPHILMLTGEYPPQRGGVGDYTRCLIGVLREAGCTITLMAPSGSDPDTSLAAPIPQGWRLLHATYSALTQSQAGCLHIQYNPGLYHHHPAVFLLSDYLNWRGWRGSIIVTFHDLQLPYLFRGAGWLRDRLLAHLARRADMSIAADTNDCLRLRELGARVTQIPLGSTLPARQLTSDVCATIRARYMIPNHVPLLAHFGTFDGLDTLIAALALIPEAVLVLAGKKVPMEQVGPIYDAACAIEAAGLSHRVRWTDYLSASDAADALAAADVVVLPFSKGGSLRHSSLIAALAQGAAVITTTARMEMPGLHKGVELLTIPPGDPHALANVVSQVLASASLRDTLGRNARHAAVTAFAWESIARAHCAVYAEACH